MGRICHEEEKFNGLRLSGGTVEGSDFYDCAFENCTIEGCRLVNSALNNCRFQGCTIINLESRYSEVKNAAFSGCSLIGIQWGELISGKGYDQPIWSLRDSLLKYNTFSNLNFRKFDFSGNRILESLFEGCAMNESSLKNCRLDRTQFLRCDLRKADFRDASGYIADVLSCRMKDARFSFPEVMNLLAGLGIRVE